MKGPPIRPLDMLLQSWFWCLYLKAIIHLREARNKKSVEKMNTFFTTFQNSPPLIFTFDLGRWPSGKWRGKLSLATDHRRPTHFCARETVEAQNLSYSLLYKANVPNLGNPATISRDPNSHPQPTNMGSKTTIWPQIKSIKHANANTFNQVLFRRFPKKNRPFKR